MDALSPRDANAQLRVKQPPQKSKLAPTQASAPVLKRANNHPSPPPEDVYEPPSTDKPDGARYRMGRLLGKGGFALCYEGKLSKTKEVFAMKMVKSQMGQKKMEQKFQTELQIHSKMRHPNIVEFVRAFSFTDTTYIVLELCPNGSLMEMAKKRKYLTEPEVRYYTVQIAGGIKYMHAKGIIHRDLKMGNIFLDKYMNVKIGDFGLAALLMSGKDMTAIRRTTLCGTPNYIAPEILEKGNQGHDNMVDIWSLGIIVFAMLTGHPPFASSDQNEIYRKARNLDYVWPERGLLDDSISDEVKDLVGSLLQKAEDRPEPDMIVQHTFFTSGWFPASDELSAAFRETSPKFPAIASRGSKAKVHLNNLKDACIRSEVGPYPSTRPGRISITWKECAAEEKAGLTPAVPLPEGVVYLPFQVWQRANSSASIDSVPELKKPEPIKTNVLLPKPLAIKKSAPQSFAAQQRALNRPTTNIAGTAASKVANKVRSVREEYGQRQVSGSTGASNESNRGLGALPVRKSSVRVRNAQNKSEEVAKAENNFQETEVPVKQRVVSQLVRTDLVMDLNMLQLPDPALNKRLAKTSLVELHLPDPTSNKEGHESLFGPSELVELMPDTSPDYVYENVLSFHAEILRALESRAPIAHHQEASRPNPKLSAVVKWVDYSGKFGLGYILSNGSIGCIFKSMRAYLSNEPDAKTPPSCLVVRDAERHLHSRSNELYKDRNEFVPMSYGVEFYEKWDEGLCGIKVNPRCFKVTESGALPQPSNLFEARRREKLTLWKKFADYMILNGREQDDILEGLIGPRKAVVDNEEDAENVMVLYQRWGDVGCWLFGDGHFQFNFPDHTKILLSQDGTWCEFYFLGIDAAHEFLRTGNLTTEALDTRGFLSYPLQTLLNFVSKPSRTKAPTRGRPPTTKPLEIDPEHIGIPEANQFREKIEFIAKAVGEWVNNGGLGISEMDTKHRLRWYGMRQKVGVQPYRHAWATVGATGGDSRRAALFDPNKPWECVEDMEIS